MAHTIHHIEICVRNGLAALRQLTHQFRFQLKASRFNNECKQWMVQSGASKFVITEAPNLHRNTTMQSDYITNWSSMQDGQNANEYAVDSVFNIALEIADVNMVVDQVSRLGGHVLQPLVTIQDKQGQGHINYAIVRSCIGNVVHTLIDSSKYYGCFLPGFSLNEAENITNCDKPLTTRFDHVTYAVPCGATPDILDWYQKCFGMERFFINSEEDINTGLVIDGEDMGRGMKLVAMEYWKCASSGLMMKNSSDSFKFVIAEPLPGQGSNQVETFLEQHGGPGIQHIGLDTDDIVQAANDLRDSGVQFIQPPDVYYTEIGKLNEIMAVGEDVNVLKSHGILLDAEADAEPHDQTSQRYLKQMFTRPLFDRDTFFLELIQRCGATGFGSGNIRALWKSVKAFLDQKHHDDDVHVEEDMGGKQALKHKFKS